MPTTAWAQAPSSPLKNDPAINRQTLRETDKPIEPRRDDGRPEDVRREDGSGMQLRSRERNEDQESSIRSLEGAVREVSPTNGEADKSNAQVLQLSDVIASTYRAFPLLEMARLQAGVAAGQQLTAVGAYDTKLEYYSLSQPVGFYETYRNGIGVARQLWWGGYTSAGYKTGRGNFEPWYKERETNGGGEFKLALVQPLLQAARSIRFEWNCSIQFASSSSWPRDPKSNTARGARCC